MQGLIDEVPRHVLRIHMRLFACRERLRVATDDEALHDLRIALRQLRSLLRPLSSVAVCEALQQRAAELGRLTGPLRDREVLQGYLQQQGFDSAAQSRLPLLQQGYLQLLDSPPLAHLLNALDDWPQQWRQAASNGQLRGLDKLIRQRLRKDRKRLAQALLDPAHDRHRLRLLVKRLRYAAEAYPQLADLSGCMRMQLKQVQSALGDWHDHWQWLQRAEVEVDLQPCVPAWREAMLSAEQQADLALEGLTAGFVRTSS
ncbi:CHAD domain-containing protein [Pseudomonas anguilliseptica]|uniref:CHAD domain-containing protein n=1 Tax=Pseudomonas anguilliseptica TaxID=53406 RepID=A0A1H5GCI9_PSEAG|nr:CHAD domain-containing protein [Pseudomonas anguilliseptica]SEE13365.1 CHAD domain-containing protein [Pseudomonas anguilliseptica]